jgi:ribosomal protein L17
MTHERIVTTLHKAKELRPWIERLVRKAQLGVEYHAGQRHLKQTLFTNASMKKLNREIAPRLTEQGLTGGFTRIAKLGRREPDRAEMAMIEIMGNPIQQWEEQQEAQAAEELGRSNFWEWEHRLLKQEQQYFKDHLDKLQD